MVDVHIRWGIRRDLEPMIAIEAASFPQPWQEEDFLACLRQRNAIVMVAEERGTDRIVGFMVYELHKSFLECVNFAVDPLFRRRGVGQQLSAKLMAKAESHRRERVRLAVNERWLDAQLFWRACGFRATAVETIPDSDDCSIRFVNRIKVGSTNEVR